jgi:hypothetical protein
MTNIEGWRALRMLAVEQAERATYYFDERQERSLLDQASSFLIAG